MVGVDVGATLAKLAIRWPEGHLTFDLLDALDLKTVLKRIHDLAPKEPLGLTGCGAEKLAEQIGLEHHLSLEFEAWGKGANVLLEREQDEALASYLLVSLGTGTSMLKVEGEATLRVGGTALGGGTLLGLGGALTGANDHQALCALAREGQRDQVDLLIQHVYPDGVGDLPPEASASNLSCIVYGGSALLDNPLMQVLLAGITASSGREVILLENGSHAGAVGALEFAAR